MTDHYAVFGNPISHSKSPQIHAAFAAQSAQDMDYTAKLTPVDGFADAAAAFFESGGRGCNVTVPFKLDAAEFAHRCSEHAVRAGAVNTLIKDRAGHILGHNTDGVGLTRDLQHNLGVALNGKRILVLGAGGAVRGVLQPLLEANPAVLTVANRTAHKAATLAQQFSDLGEIQGCSLNEIPDSAFDVVINGTSSSLGDGIPDLHTACVKQAACYDMVYSATDTPFIAWCKTHGAAVTADGIGMLFEQAAESFLLWRGVRPDVAQARAAVGMAS